MKTLDFPKVDKDEAFDALRTLVPEFIALLRGVKNPNAIAVGHWTIRDLTAHMVDFFENYTRVAEGKGTAEPNMENISNYNAERVAAIAETDIGALADRIEEASGPFLDSLGSIEGDPMVPWTSIEIPISTVIGLAIAELLVHGYDVASAEKRPWELDPHKVAITIRSISPVTIHYLDPEKAGDLRACFDLRLRGETQLYFIVEDGKMSIEEPSDRKVDVHISADPAAFLLVGFGRINQWAPVAKGQMITWGRKPWLALKFGTILRNP